MLGAFAGSMRYSIEITADTLSPSRDGRFELISIFIVRMGILMIVVKNGL
jgi:hypothetical protein